MKCSVQTVTQRRIVVCAAFAFVIAAVGCSDDLPTMDPIPEDEGMRMDDQETAGSESEDDAKAGTGGASMTTRNAGRGGTSAADGGRGGSGGMSSGGSGDGASGNGASGNGASGSGGMSGGTMMGGGGNGDRPAGSGGAAGAPPSGPVVAACMGRAGETVCDNAAMIECGDAGQAKNRENCMTAEQCRAGLAAGTCGTCDPGAIECMGAELRECSMSGEFTVKETCKSEALCNGAQGACDAPACEADQHKCETGQLLKCKDDLTEFEVLDSCPMELCDEAGKKCNVCVPSIKECEGNTLKTCAADGSGFTEMACSGTANQCVEDRCVQCTSNDDCQVESDCQQGSCNMQTGMCNPPTSKPLGTECSSATGGRVCGLGGICIECNTDRDCAATERCGLLGCVQRVALQAGIALLPGTISVTLNAGYALKSTSPTNLGRVTYSAGFLGGGGTVPTSGDGDLLQADADMARTVTFTAAANGSACQPERVSDTRLILKFANPTTDTNPTPNCDDQSVTIYAAE